MSELSLTKLKTNSDNRSAENDKADNRKRSILVLILDYLQEFRYIESFSRLQKESSIDLRKVAVADNIDLNLIIQEFENYYFIKFGKHPKLIKKSDISSSPDNPKQLSKREHKPRSKPKPAEQINSLQKLKPIIPPICEKQEKPDDVIEAIGIKTGQSSRLYNIPVAAEPTKDSDFYENRMLKPMPVFETLEYRELASLISRDILMKNPEVNFTEIAGLEKSKRLIKEAIVFPMKFPHLFKGLLRPWKGILLYGPPGTGKTMLAKAVATECKTTFFNISAASIVSKWRGDSEKLIRVLFELARYHAPSTIFLDELESIMSHRSSDGTEHEGSRRMKTELLIQLDGLAKSDDLVFLLAASNLPWDLDTAMLRRLEKRILIDLPDMTARHSLFKQLLSSHFIENNHTSKMELDFVQFAEETEGYSGSDINLVCREAAMRPLRTLFDRLDVYDSEPNSGQQSILTI
ncbi:P-loop containing nucleoside triphosphate hydrolase protein [Globomyces pollinis-pini]|nr:P-loop containing nucleoside triphosphate hydrolase protein [Globomyces pollinis-pini]